MQYSSSIASFLAGIIWCQWFLFYLSMNFLVHVQNYKVCIQRSYSRATKLFMLLFVCFWLDILFDWEIWTRQSSMATLGRNVITCNSDQFYWSFSLDKKSNILNFFKQNKLMPYSSSLFTLCAMFFFLFNINHICKRRSFFFTFSITIYENFIAWSTSTFPIHPNF